MDTKIKWINDKRAKLKGELAGLQNQAQETQQQLQQIAVAIIAKQGELKAIEEVAEELKKKDKK